MNYASLVALLPDYLGRSGDTNITSNASTFVGLAEAKLNRALRCREMVTRAAFSITGETVAVPTDFAGAVAFELDGEQLSFLTPEEMVALDHRFSDGTPWYYTIIGTNFRFLPTPTATASAYLTYYAKLPGIETNSTNWLIASHPDIYLYAVALEASIYLNDEADTAKYAGLLQTTVDDLQKSARREAQGETLSPQVQAY